MEKRIGWVEAAKCASVCSLSLPLTVVLCVVIEISHTILVLVFIEWVKNSFKIFYASKGNYKSNCHVDHH